MSESTFRAVVAAVLVAALALAVVALVVLRPAGPSPTPTVPPSSAPSVAQTPAATPTPTPGPAFDAPEITAVGSIPRGGSSGDTLVVRFVEPAPDAIPDAPGSFRITLADGAGAGSTLSFTGTASVDAPGSLGVDVALVAPNVLKVSIKAADGANIERITITGLGIAAMPTAALGPIRAVVDGFTGSLEGGIVIDTLPSPGTVVAGS